MKWRCSRFAYSQDCKYHAPPIFKSMSQDIINEYMPLNQNKHKARSFFLQHPNIFYIQGPKQGPKQGQQCLQSALCGRFFLQLMILLQTKVLYAILHIQMFNISENYEKLWKAIIRPPRATYKKQDVGPEVFTKKGMKIKRTEVQLTNKKGYKLVGSHYEPYNRPCKMLPCVIYLHGNSSCQIQAQNCLTSLLCHDITLFSFDFAGCGISGGEYISLGYHQREDVDVVFNYLRSLDSVSSIGIWGRSMGAVTALMYADRNHEIGCLVLDSPFSNLEVLCKELAKRFVSNLSAFSGIALTFMSKTIKEKNNFDIEEIDPLKNVTKAFIPALFIAAKEDDFILPHHTDILYEKYSGEKQKLLVEGDHNSRRDQDVLDKISSFFYFGLCVKDLVIPDPAFIQEQKKKKIKGNAQKEENIKNLVSHEVHFDGQVEDEEELAKALQLSLALSQKQQKKQAEKKQQKKEQKKQ